MSDAVQLERTRLIDALIRAYECAELVVVASDDDGTTLRVHSGMRAHKANVAHDALLAHLGALGESERRAAITSFARGVHGVLSEPKKSRGPETEFVEAATTLLPSIEGPFFVSGAIAAGGDEPFTTPFGDGPRSDGLVLTYSFELDIGVRTVTSKQVEEWGCTPERLEKASISILYHRSWGLDFTKPKGRIFEEFGGGDGLDSARVLMMDQWDYHRVRSGMLFAIPAAGCLMVCDDTSPAACAAFEAAAKQNYAEADSPLSQRVWCFVKGRRQREPIA